MNKFISSFIAVVFCSFQAVAQMTITPAAAQTMPIAIKGATIHCANSKVIKSGVLAFENGKITHVEDMRSSTILNQDKYLWIDATGKQIYPGLIALNTQLGLNEIEAVKTTADYRELGDFNPNLSTYFAYNTVSEVIPTVRTNGILFTQISPVGGVISGQSAVMKLDGWNWEDALYKADDGIYMYWPNLDSPSRGYQKNKDRTKPSEKFEKAIREITEFFEAAQAYCNIAKPAPINLMFEAMRKVFTNEKNLYIRAQNSIEIQSAVQAMDKFAIKPIIVGGAEAWKTIDLLKEKNISVILTEPHSLPVNEDDLVSQNFQTAAELVQNNINIAISVDGFWQVRNLAFQVGQCIAFGLDKEKALDCVTINAAKILGIDKSTGSLEAGKDASFIISSGDIFDISSNQVTEAYINGAKLDLNNKQQVLYHKYRKKYGLE